MIMLLNMKERSLGNMISLIVLSLFFIGFVALRVSQLGPLHANVVLADRTLTVLVAQTPKQVYTGLGGRETLDDADGMILVFDRLARHAIVMRDMRFPIDIVWIDRGTIVDIAPNIAIEPGKDDGALTVYFPRTEANIVLELPAGKAAAYGLKIGDTVTVKK